MRNKFLGTGETGYHPLRKLRTIYSGLRYAVIYDLSVAWKVVFSLLVLAAAVLDTLAYVAFNLGIASAYTSIVTALASLFSAVTVLLAWAILRERLAPAQWTGVAVILAGVLLVSL